MGKRPKRHSKGKTKQSTRGEVRSGAGPFVAVLLGSLSFALLFGWDGLLPLLTVPLIVGAFLGLMASSLSESLLTGGSAGLLGSGLACLFYRQDAFVAYVNRTNPAAVADVTGSLWQQFVLPILRANPVNDPHVGPFVVVAVGTFVTLAFTAGAWWTAARLASIGDQRWLGLVVLAALGSCLAFTMFVTDSPFIRSISTEPAAKSYAFDPVINLKTYYLILGGRNYYDAIMSAAAGDTRINDIKNGKWGLAWGITSPTHIRQPEVFYLWAAVGYFGASGIMWASLLLAIGLWVVWYWFLFPTLGQRALFLGPALFPLFAVHMAWFNLFHPDWWAAMMLMYSAAFLVRKRFIASAVFALVTVLFREVFVFYLFVLIVVGLVQWLLKKRPVGDVLPFGIALVVFIGAYAAHYAIEAPYIGVKVKESTLGGILSVANRPLAIRFLGPTSYLMFPYGDAVVPAFVLSIVGAIGLFVLLRGSEQARFALPGYLLAFLAFLAIVGASSSYWGQDLSLLAVTGCAILLAGLDRLGRGFDDERA